MTITLQQHRIIIKPGNNALQFDTIHEEDDYSDMLLSDLIEEYILKILCFFHINAFSAFMKTGIKPMTAYSPASLYILNIVSF